MSVYVSIGNSDDKLSQRRWVEFIEDVSIILDDHSRVIHGAWYSEPKSFFQNACWCFEPKILIAAVDMRDRLRLLAAKYGQDSIAWAECPETDFLSGDTP